MPGPYRLLLTGVDGSTWDLLSPDSPVQVQAGWEGLTGGEVVQRWTELIGDGDRYDGSRSPRLVLRGKIRVGGVGPGLAYRELDRRWSRALSRDALATLTVLAEDDAQRSLRVRLGGRAGDPIDLEPGVLGWDVRTLELVADSPLWAGDAVTTSWAPVAGSVDFFGGGPVGSTSLKATPFVISPSGGFGDRSVSNAGDHDAWPTWRITGPALGTTLAVGTQVIDVPGTVPPGQVLTVQTRPPRATFGDGSRAWSLLTGRKQFAPIPARSTVTVSASTAQTTSATLIECVLTPLWDRAA